MTPTSIAVIGVGKIAQDQHLPVIAKDKRFALKALVSQRGIREAGVPTFHDLSELLASSVSFDAVAICTPPEARTDIARQALAAGKDVMLEKPPAPTVAEMNDLAGLAVAAGRVIFATWHSRYNAAVDEARKLLSGRKIRALHVEWKEDVRRWHPGQEWIWRAGGFGVFDPGINALSIVTTILPGPLFVAKAELAYPANRDTPIAASLAFSSSIAESAGSVLSAEFDWRQEGDQSWNIDITLDDGAALRLTHGGSKLWVGGTLVVDAPMQEYEGVYDHFAHLLERRESAMDSAPFQLVADASLIGRRVEVAAFDW